MDLRTKLLGLLASVLVLFASYNSAQATHAMGADMYVDCLGGNQYRVRLQFYRDCAGINVGSTRTININSASCGQSISLTVTRIPGSPTEVSPLCVTSLANSTCNGGFLPGVEQHIYEGVVTLPAQCTDWVFSFQLAARNNAITTLNNPGSQDIYIETHLNNLDAPCNSSPRFSSIPVPFICNNQPFVYNHGATDPDGDSLVYFLVDAQEAQNDPVNYAGGFSGTNPMSTSSGTIIDTLTGNVFLSPNAIQIGVFAVRVDEYRNDTLIGSTVRDIQVTVLNCSNNNPTLPGISAATGGNIIDSFTAQVCSGNTLVLTLPGIDPDALDNLTLTSNSAFRNSTFTVSGTNPAVGTFTWTPTAGDVGVNNFTLNLQDDACPITATTARSITVIVDQGTTLAGSDTSYCVGSPGARLEVDGGTSWTWDVLYGDTNSIPCDTCKVIWVQPSVATAYEVTSDVSPVCKNKDTVIVFPGPAGTLIPFPDTTICRNQVVQLFANPIPASPHTYTWSPAGSLNGAFIPDPFATPLDTTTYIVEARNSVGCRFYDTIDVNVFRVAPIVDITLDQDYVCPGDTIQLNASGGTNYQFCGAIMGSCATPILSTIGGNDGQMGNRTPFMGDRDDAKTQILYRAGELTAMGMGAGMIESIAFHVEDDDQQDEYDNFTIKIACTNQNEYTSDNFIITTFTTVYNQNIDINAGWETFNFTTPYYWDGVSNLVVEVCFNNPDGDRDNENDVYYTQMAYDCVVRDKGNNNDGCTMNNVDSRGDQRPQTRFTHCAALNPVDTGSYFWTPSIFLSSDTVQDPQAVVWGTRSYIVRVSDNDTSQCDGLAAITVHQDTTISVIAGNDTTVCVGSTVNLTAEGSIAFNTGNTWFCGADPGGCAGGLNLTVVGTSPTYAGLGTSPFQGGYEDGRIQYLFTAAELNGQGFTGGTLEALAWEIFNNQSTIPYNDLNIRMGCTDLDSLSAFVTGLTSVFNGNDTAVSGWNTFQFDVPYYWDGNSNLIIEVCFDNNAWTAFDEVYYTPTAFNSVFFDYTDASSGCNLSAGNAGNNRPNTRFAFCNELIIDTLIYSWVPNAGVTNATTGNANWVATNNQDFVVSVNNFTCIAYDTMSVFVDLPVFDTSVITICEGNTANIFGVNRSVAGFYSDSVANPVSTCDSILLVELVVLDTSLTSLNVSICQGFTHFAGGSNQSASGVYVDVLTNRFGCDSTVVTTLTVNDTFLINVLEEICEGETYLAAGALQTTSGVYIDNLLSVNGCDSTVVTTLDVLDSALTVINVTVCEGESHMAGGAAQTTSGTYIDLLSTYESCDSTVITNLTVNDTALTVLNVMICEGTSHTAGGAAQTTSGTYIDILSTSQGCDSTVITNLTVNDTALTVLNVEICEGASHNAGGAAQTTPGTYVDVLSTYQGCDSTVITNLTVNDTALTVFNIDICFGQSHTAGGAAQTTSGTYVDVLSTFQGCDSTIITNLTVLDTSLTVLNVVICEGASHIAGGAAQTSTGTYFDLYTNSVGCDSTVITNLTVNDTALTVLNIDICFGQSHPAGGSAQTTTGTYIDVLSTYQGCDSTIITNLTVNDTALTVLNIDICFGSSHVAGGAAQTTSGTYVDVLSTYQGCDSTIITNLTVLDTSLTVLNVMICEGVSHVAGGAAQTTTGTYFDLYTNSVGCDSTVITNLTVNDTALTVLNVVICEGASHTAGGAAQTTSGSYIDILSTYQGCDSTVITNLTVNDTALTVLNIDICFGSSHVAGGAAQTTSGTYVDVLSTYQGCDSTIITNLTVLDTSLTVLNVVICEGASHVAGGAAQTASGVYYDLLTNSVGCDSTVITNLTVNDTTLTVLNIDICFGQSHTAGGAAQTTSGTYVDVLSTYQGCDSTIITNLNVMDTALTILDIVICEGSSHTAGGATQTTTGTYIDILSTYEGCDSTIITNLTVNDTALTVLNIDICFGQSHIAGGAAQTTSGTYVDVLSTYQGCDSTVITNLTVLDTSLTIVNVVICEGASHVAGGAAQTTTGTYYDLLTNSVGCDSTVITNLTVNDTALTVLNVVICEGASHTAGGAAQTTTGTYIDILSTYQGCDSTVITNLTVNDTALTVLNIDICFGSSHVAGGAAQTTSGTYVDVLSTYQGCDSTVITNLTVLDTSLTVLNVVICEGASHVAGGAAQTTTGTYYDLLTNSVGCDSTVITYLTVNDTALTVLNIDICFGQSHTAGGAAQTTSGTYVDVLSTYQGCDSTIITNLTVLDTALTVVDVVICEGASHTAGGAAQTTTGTYVDVLSAANGCDSTIITNLTVNDTVLFAYTVSICEGSSLFAGGANQTTSGTYIDVFSTYQGCDSTVITTLIVEDTALTVLDVVICEGASHTAGGFAQTTTGTYVDFLIAANGCDSTVITNLTVNDTALSIVDVVICEGASHTAGGAAQTTTGTYVDVHSTYQGCDSTVITNLTVNDTALTVLNIDICFGSSHTAGGAAQTTTGTYVDVLSTYQGCDSTIITNLTVLDTSLTVLNVVICEGASHVAGGAAQTTTGVYYDLLTNSAGCDSTVITNLTVNDTALTVLNIDICFGQSHTAGGSAQTTSGTYVDVLSTYQGCDSTIITNLTVLDTALTVVDVVICEGASHTAGGSAQTTTGTYVDVLSAANGCDSTVITNLTVNDTVLFAYTVSICEGSSLFAGGANQTTSGTYIDVFSTYQGCDSTVITTLTVEDTVTTVLDIVICEGQSHTAGGFAQTTSGTYSDWLIAANGCDSLVITNLTVNDTALTIVDVVICEGASHTAGGSAQTTSGTYVDVLSTYQGCDSTIITNLTVNDTVLFAYTVSICEGSSLFAGGANQTTSGTYIDVFSTYQGCDSTVITTLIVEDTALTVLDVVICEGQSHVAVGMAQTTTGTYVDLLIAANGCDSTVITNLTVNDTALTVLNIDICFGQSHTAGGSVQTTSGTYVDVLSTYQGCDSTIITNLTVLDTALTVVDVVICEGASHTAGGSAQTTTGTYVDVLSAANGCDSTVITNLTVNDTVLFAYTVSICEGSSLFAGGSNQTTSGTYIDVFSTYQGCDSTVITTLIVLDTAQTIIDVTICEGQSHTAGGFAQTTSGTYIDLLIAANGCDSTIVTNLTVNDTALTVLNVDICFGQSHTAGGSAQTTSGPYVDVLSTYQGCDSTIITNLTVLDTALTIVDVVICEGSSHTAGGAAQTTTGTYVDVLSTYQGCDSTVITNLTVNDTALTVLDVVICEGTSHTAGGAAQTTTGTYVDVLSTYQGCDSTIITNLIVNDTALTVLYIDICFGQSHTAGGAAQMTSGTYFDILSTYQGCDSTVVTVLTVLDTSEVEIVTLICETDSIWAGGAFQNTAGTYIEILSAANGCDSTTITYLSIWDTAITHNPITICYGQSYYADGSPQTVSGTYVDVYNTVNGCDSTVYTYLTVLDTAQTIVNVDICQGETHIAGGAPQSLGGIYVDVLTAANGCDSTVITNLHVNDTFRHIRSVAICMGETFLAGGMTQYHSGTFFDTLSTTNGCDSIIETRLTVLDTARTNIVVTICAGETHFAAGMIQATSGFYFDTLANTVGCDSIVRTWLIVRDTSRTDLKNEICEGNSLWAGGTFQTTSGIYFDTLVNIQGCDSIVRTNLKVIDTQLLVQTVHICEGETYWAGGTLQDTTGRFLDIFTNARGCDSTVVTNLIHHPNFDITRDVVICEAQGHWAGGTIQYTSGVYVDQLQSVWGCDSIVTTNLLVTDTIRLIIDTAICRGEAVWAGGRFQTESGRYFDFLSTTFGCDSIVVTNLIVNELPDVDITGPGFFCSGDSVTLTAEGNFTEVLWNTGSTENSIYTGTEGLYSVTVSDANGCGNVSLDYFLMESGNFIMGVTPKDTLVKIGQPVQIDLSLDYYGVDITWNPPYFLDCWDCEDPVSTPGFSTDYDVVVRDTFTGCIDTASVSIEVDETLEFFVPNTFTPNGDGMNDIFQAYGNGVTYFHLLIHDRWGEKIFESYDINEGWDGYYKGELVPPGVYVYYVKVGFGNYTNLPDNHPYKQGSVTVIR